MSSTPLSAPNSLKRKSSPICSSSSQSKRFQLRSPHSIFDESTAAVSLPACSTVIPYRPAINANSSIFTKLSARQSNELSALQFARRSAVQKFSRFRLAAAADSHDVEAAKTFDLLFLQKRSKIVEITAAQDIIVALTHSGVCCAFDRKDFRRLCFLNVTNDEVIRSLFYNKQNRNLITVSVFKQDGFGSLKCRTTSIDCIKRGRPDLGSNLFSAEALNWPGFVEFDDVNKKVLTFSATDKVYKVWDLSDYRLLYVIQDADIDEIKISPGIMLCVYRREAGHIQLRILNIADGKEIRALKHLLHRNKRVDFIEQFNEKLLVKQSGENLQIVDIRTNEIVDVDQNLFPTPSAFIFLYENQRFLTFLDRQIFVWNFRGELLSRFADHELWFPDCNTNNIFINPEQDTIISYCREKDGSKIGSINISNILTGQLIGKIAKSTEFDISAVKKSSEPQQQQAWKMRNLVAKLPGQRHLIEQLESEEESSEEETDVSISASDSPARSAAATAAADETENEFDENHESEEFNSPTRSRRFSSQIRTAEITPNTQRTASASASELNCTSSPVDFDEFESATRHEEFQSRQSEFDKREALKDITALFFNEETNEIFTGNKHGMLHVWGN